MVATGLLTILLCSFAALDACAGDGIQTAGDILRHVLPATAGGLTLELRDYKGTLQFGESFALTEGGDLRVELHGQ